MAWGRKGPVGPWGVSVHPELLRVGVGDIWVWCCLTTLAGWGYSRGHSLFHSQTGLHRDQEEDVLLGFLVSGSPIYWENVRVDWLGQAARLLSLAKVKTLSSEEAVLSLAGLRPPSCMGQGDRMGH